VRLSISLDVVFAERLDVNDISGRDIASNVVLNKLAITGNDDERFMFVVQMWLAQRPGLNGDTGRAEGCTQ